MARTQIDGDQVEDESLTGDDILDESLLKEDLSLAVQAEINANTAKISDINHVTIELPNVDNTSDVDKPVSTAQQTALDLKTDKGTLTTKGDIYVRNATIPTRLGIGANTFALIADTVSAVGMAWKQIVASWVSFDPTGLLNFEATDTNVDLALQRIGNFSVGDLTEAEGFTSFGQETTNSTGWVSKSGFPVTSAQVKTAGEFSLRWSAEVGQTKTNRNFGFRTRWRPSGGTWEDMGTVNLSVNRDGDVMMQAGFREVTLPTNNNIEIDIQHGQTTSGQSSIIQNVSVELRRIGD